MRISEFYSELSYEIRISFDIYSNIARREFEKQQQKTLTQYNYRQTGLLSAALT